MYRIKTEAVKLLLVEDDMATVKSTTEFLEREGFKVYSCSGQASAIEMVKQQSFDIALLDISLADGNGFSLCMNIKARSDIPVIFVSSSRDEYSVVTALDIGADDYIPKPVRQRELISRIKNILRRRNKTRAILEYGSIKVDTVRGMVTKNGREVFLSALEYRILLIFLTNRGRVLPRSQLLEEIWDVGGEYVNDNTLTVYIKRIREKIEDDPQNPKVIKTVRGLGYKAGD